MGRQVFPSIHNTYDIGPCLECGSTRINNVNYYLRDIGDQSDRLATDSSACSSPITTLTEHFDFCTLDLNDSYSGYEICHFLSQCRHGGFNDQRHDRSCLRVASSSESAAICVSSSRSGLEGARRTYCERGGSGQVQWPTARWHRHTKNLRVCVVFHCFQKGRCEFA